MDKLYSVEASPIAKSEAIVQGDKYRFTILTSRMIRVEYQEDGIFEDRPTQIVLNRDFEVPEFKVLDFEDELEIITKHVHVFYSKEKPSKNSLRIEVKGGISAYHSVWYYGEDFETLGGTARTLDKIDGAVDIGKGLMSKMGFSSFEDSHSAILTEDNWVNVRDVDTVDVYFFGYARDYRDCLRDFYQLTGQTPLLPRFTLGNWWSRYFEYTEESYKALINRFEREKVPFSVAIIDMDWHLVNIDNRFGSGWTGYSWNKELFPDPKRFLSWLHEHHLAVSLNVHPADGVKAHEDAYVDMAKSLEIDYKNEEVISFDFTNQDFVNSYFKYLHHPHEEIGVDFWWVDWQSGDISKVKGMDPLWMLNHYHFHDNKRGDKRPLTFSRYVGLGSHRYPIGFSGDSIISWESLDFQPYFTATASNVGYGWWSHDIGGHMLGIRDDELALRWVQFGVFSPIMRLHSYKSPFAGKEPWNYGLETENIMKEFLRLRHQLVPYLYSMNYRNAYEGLTLIEPMYYEHPWQENAYQVPNQYYFGSELVVAPITSKINEVTKYAKVTTWLPEGLWFDFFNNRVYKGNRKLNVYRGHDSIPVFAKAGAIIPMDQEIHNDTSNPDKLHIRIYPGANNSFTLIEDDGKAIDQNPITVRTKMTTYWHTKNKLLSFTMNKPEGDTTLLSDKRSYQLEFVAIKGDAEVTVTIDGAVRECDVQQDQTSLWVDLPFIKTDSEIKISIKQVAIRENKVVEEVETLLNRSQFSIPKKEYIYNLVRTTEDLQTVIGELESMELPVDLREALNEIIWAND